MYKKFSQSLTVKNQVVFSLQQKNHLCTLGIMAVYCENYSTEQKKLMCQWNRK